MLRAVVVAGTAAVAGCPGGEDAGDDRSGGTESTRPSPATLAENEVVTLSGSPCEAIAGTRFESIEQPGGGSGPDGRPARTHWWVRFEDGTYEFAHADVVESGS